MVSLSLSFNHSKLFCLVFLSLSSSGFFFIRRQLVFLCCQIISHLFLITFVCTWFLFTHQSLHGISFYLFPESMELGLYREGKKKKGMREGGRIAFVDVDHTMLAVCSEYTWQNRQFIIFAWKCSIQSNHIAKNMLSHNAMHLTYNFRGMTVLQIILNCDRFT